ncbi:carboxymuconolactone decarboxylase family protein [Microbacterium sp.]|uniref:carboxymuconolactone decarboxylase family protein n=1 Tax=Microbacterium sp. TaxID=51671 RepID=UPI003A88521E
MAELTARQREIKAEFQRRRGYWAPDWELILGLDPEFLAAYTDLSAYAVEHGGLDLRTRELIYVATCASVTHQHPIGIRVHGRNALRAGATPQELLAVMELVSTLGVATVHLAVEELERATPGTVDELQRASGTTGERVRQLVERFEEVYAAPGDDVESVIRAVPEFYSAVIEMAAIPRSRTSPLSARDVALISFAVNALVTHLDERALRRDIANAKAAGVTAYELLDVCMQIAGIGVHAITVGVPILAELIAEQEGAQA